MGLMNNLSVQMLNARRRRPSASSRLNLPFKVSIESLSESDKFTRRQDLVRLNEYNDNVKDWGKNTSVKLKASVKSLIDRDLLLSDSIKPKVYYDRKYAKEANRVGFTFVREGVYVHKGAGRGKGGTKGSKWFNLKGERMSTNPDSLFKMGTGSRQPKEWFDPVVEQELLQLADLVSDFSAGLVIDTTTLFIN
ncbi:MAG: hypothetical protein E6772_17960 [Dysgonomonas sp.]|nr:hypothetical protein [Dysgonomonas sp.]